SLDTALRNSTSSWSIAGQRGLESLDQRAQRPGGQLHRRRVDDEPARDLADGVDQDEPVLAERLAGLGDVDDAIAQPGQRPELDRARQLDDLGGAALAPQVLARRARVLRRVAHVHLRAVVDARVRTLGDDHATAPDAEVERLVQIAALLVEDVRPGDADVGG